MGGLRLEGLGTMLRVHFRGNVIMKTWFEAWETVSLAWRFG
jgi:hypothetical protein